MIARRAGGDDDDEICVVVALITLGNILKSK